ncbi:serine--tRNA ligase [Candidatus Marinamargulisbacteria bacterium SCGC AG-343-D04]|nr:serine--tRNA ligase [Candidatus Marinamargulisbacteria bacterium SCGC AG-343-D04]
MLDIKKIRENPEEVFNKLKLRGVDQTLFNDYVDLDRKWRDALIEVEQLKEKRNALTPKGKPSQEQLSQLKELAESVKKKQDSLLPLEESLKALALQFPNMSCDVVPEGDTEDHNVEIRKEGVLPSFDFSPLSHDELGVQCGMLDFDTAATVTGSRFVNLRGKGAALERALIGFMLDEHTLNHGYEEVLPSSIVNSRALQGTGQLPKFSDDLFKLEDTDYYLSPTAEVQLTNLFQGKVLAEEDLPISVTGYTSCFRKEAGSYGKDMKGLIRLHQFNKVELVKIVHPERSMEEWQMLLGHAESILKKLKLPYRVVELCVGDLGFGSARTVDLEVWFPSQNRYREISSCSNFLDFQSRRAMIRYKGKDTGKASFVHTLNGSGLAVGRTLAAIMEHYQDVDGSIEVPDVLKEYVRFERICKITKNL